MRMKFCQKMKSTPADSVYVCGLELTVVFQGRQWASLSGWLTVTQTPEHNDCWHRSLLSLTLKRPFKGSDESIFFFIFFLSLSVRLPHHPPTPPTSILIALSFLFAHPVYKLKGTLWEGKSSQQLQSQPSASISSTTECTCECVRGGESGRRKVIGAWWNGGGSKKQDAWWPESFRKQLARCYTNFRTDLISCYQSCRTLCSARLQMC